MKKTVIVITGPTASGKSGIAIELAKRLDGIVISADSMQIYKKLNIGTAKVTEKEACGIEHRLIDICNTQDKFSVSDYKKICYKEIRDIFSINKVPIIAGGTGLYINAIVNNMDFNEISLYEEKNVEQKLIELTLGKSPEKLYEVLKKLDPVAAKNIEKNNTKRVIRAIKMNLLGIKKSDINSRNDLWSKNEGEYNFFVVYVDMPRDLLYHRINQRVDMMVDSGILDEARLLYSLNKKDITANQAIGYKEFFPYIQGKASIEECTEVLKQKTRNYAKRQITWFKKLPYNLVVNGMDGKDKIIADILKEYNEKNI